MVFVLSYSTGYRYVINVGYLFGSLGFLTGFKLISAFGVNVSRILAILLRVLCPISTPLPSPLYTLPPTHTPQASGGPTLAQCGRCLGTAHCVPSAEVGVRGISVSKTGTY